MKMHKDRLTERQRLFCELYVGPGRHCAALSARLAGYAPGCSHVTGCKLLQQPKIAATVRGLEDAVAQEIGVSRQKLIAQLVAAAELAKLMMQPSSIISAMKNIALISGYYRQEGAKPVGGRDDGGMMDRLRGMTDAQLAKIAQAGAATAV